MPNSPAMMRRPDFWALAVTIVIAVATALALNTFVFAFSPRSALASGEGHVIWSPPAWVIGGVWVCLFAMMGATRWRLISIGSADARRAAAWTTWLMLLCAAYPIYTFGLRAEALGFFGNLVTLGFSSYVARTSGRVDLLCTLAPAATAGWLVFATLLIADHERWFW